MSIEKLKKLLEIGRQMAETRELTPLLEAAMCLALGFASAEYGYIVLLDGDDLEFRIGQDQNGNKLPQPNQQISRTLLNQVISTGKSTITADAISSLDTPSVLALQIRSVMCAPLISHGEILGALYVENRSQSDLFVEADLELLEYFSAQAAVSIQNAILNEALEARVAARTAELARANVRLHELAITDPLTGLYNRRHLFELAETELARTRRYRRNLAAIMLDIDHFKMVNDRFGHLAGDKVLEAVAGRVHAAIRDVDILGRYGGEEFAILMPDTTLAGGVQLAERLRLAIASEQFETGKEAVTVTVSLGVTGYAGLEAISIDTLLDRADQALYRAKDGGRNRVAVYRAE